MHKICVIGHFGFGQNLLNGQTVKTKIVTAEIEAKFGRENVIKVDSAGGVRKIPQLCIRIPQLLRQCDHMVILPAQNGVKFLTPLLTFWNFFFKKKLHYVVIGGWLPEYLKKKAWLRSGLKKFAGIYVETSTMKTALEKQGFENLFVMPNCKQLTILQPSELTMTHEGILRICTFSRVMKEKGIEDLVTVVNKINRKGNYLLLDIYGQVDANQQEWFSELQAKFTDHIRYGGAVPYDKSVEVLRQYDLLIFPTKFFTEVIPCTIIDAYAAGVPVISSRWESFHDVVDDGRTGIGYSFDDVSALESALEQCIADRSMINTMKVNCLARAYDFTVDNAMKVLLNNL